MHSKPLASNFTIATVRWLTYKPRFRASMPEVLRFYKSLPSMVRVGSAAQIRAIKSCGAVKIVVGAINSFVLTPLAFF